MIGGLLAWLIIDAGLWPLMVAKVVQEIVGYGMLGRRAAGAVHRGQPPTQSA
jgi:hypothetical protein